MPRHWQRLRRSWLKHDLLQFYCLDGLYSIKATMIALKACSGHCALSVLEQQEINCFCFRIGDEGQVEEEEDEEAEAKEEEDEGQV